MEPGNWTIAGLAGAAIIMGLVQLFKTRGIRKNDIPLVAVVTGIVLALGSQISMAIPSTKPWFEAIVLGTSVGLWAVGLYGVKNSGEDK
jgi:predicted RND superfamily exporter protein